MGVLNGQCRRLTHAGFTLIELLAVVAVVAILTSILLGGLARIRGLSDQTSDVAALRTIHQAVLSYATDNQGGLPRGAGGSANMIRDLGQGGYLAHSYEYIDDPENATRFLPSYLWNSFYRDTNPTISQWWRSSFSFNRYLFGNYTSEGQSNATYYGRVNLQDTLPTNWMFTETDIPGRSNFAVSGKVISQGWNRERNNENLVVTVGGDVSKVRLPDDMTFRTEWIFPYNSNVIKNP